MRGAMAHLRPKLASWRCCNRRSSSRRRNELKFVNLWTEQCSFELDATIRLSSLRGRRPWFFGARRRLSGSVLSAYNRQKNGPSVGVRKAVIAAIWVYAIFPSIH
jgi:hypothetical protein